MNLNIIFSKNRIFFFNVLLEQLNLVVITRRERVKVRGKKKETHRRVDKLNKLTPRYKEQLFQLISYGLELPTTKPIQHKIAVLNDFLKY